MVKLQVPNLSYISPKVVLNCPTLNIWAVSVAHYLVQSLHAVCECKTMICIATWNPLHDLRELNLPRDFTRVRLGGDMLVAEFPVPHPAANDL